MSDSNEQTDEEALQELPHAEREAILRLLAWLATRDDSVDEKELEFLEEFEELLALEDDDRAILEELDELDTIDEVVDGIETDWVRALLVGKLITAAWVDGTYDARERVGIRRLCRAMGIADDELGTAEAEILEALEKASDGDIDPDDESDSGRYFKIAGAAVLGGGLVAATGGLAAPAIGGAIGSAMGLSGAAATSAGLAALGDGALSAGGPGMAGGTAVVSAALGAEE
ncbi:MAG: hypothetical protein ABEN55_18755 [Bradymonadaceae bacterium]